MSSMRMNQFYKTKMCPWYYKGRCERGPTCRFAHYDWELRTLPNLSKTSLCPQLMKLGQCPDLQRCRFAHHSVELRATDDLYKTSLCFLWMRGRCDAGDQCRHAHGVPELRSLPKEAVASAEKEYTIQVPQASDVNNFSEIQTMTSSRFDRCISQSTSATVNVVGERQSGISIADADASVYTTCRPQTVDPISEKLMYQAVVHSQRLDDSQISGSISPMNNTRSVFEIEDRYGRAECPTRTKPRNCKSEHYRKNIASRGRNNIDDKCTIPRNTTGYSIGVSNKNTGYDPQAFHNDTRTNECQQRKDLTCHGSAVQSLQNVPNSDAAPGHDGTQRCGSDNISTKATETFLSAFAHFYDPALGNDQNSSPMFSLKNSLRLSSPSLVSMAGTGKDNEDNRRPSTTAGYGEPGGVRREACEVKSLKRVLSLHHLKKEDRFDPVTNGQLDVPTSGFDASYRTAFNNPEHTMPLQNNNDRNNRRSAVPSDRNVIYQPSRERLHYSSSSHCDTSTMSRPPIGRSPSSAWSNSRIKVVHSTSDSRCAKITSPAESVITVPSSTATRVPSEHDHTSRSGCSTPRKDMLDNMLMSTTTNSGRDVRRAVSEMPLVTNFEDQNAVGYSASCSKVSELRKQSDGSDNVAASSANMNWHGDSTSQCDIPLNYMDTQASGTLFIPQFHKGLRQNSNPFLSSSVLSNRCIAHQNEDADERTNTAASSGLNFFLPSIEDLTQGERCVNSRDVGQRKTANYYCGEGSVDDPWEKYRSTGRGSFDGADSQEKNPKQMQKTRTYSATEVRRLDTRVSSIETNLPSSLSSSNEIAQELRDDSLEALLSDATAKFDACDLMETNALLLLASSLAAASLNVETEEATVDRRREGVKHSADCSKVTSDKPYSFSPDRRFASLLNPSSTGFVSCPYGCCPFNSCTCSNLLENRQINQKYDTLQDHNSPSDCFPNAKRSTFDCDGFDKRNIQMCDPLSNVPFACDQQHSMRRLMNQMKHTDESLRNTKADRSFNVYPPFQRTADDRKGAGGQIDDFPVLHTAMHPHRESLQRVATDESTNPLVNGMLNRMSFGDHRSADILQYFSNIDSGVHSTGQHAADLYDMRENCQSTINRDEDYASGTDGCLYTSTLPKCSPLVAQANAASPLASAAGHLKVADASYVFHNRKHGEMSFPECPISLSYVG